MGWIASLAAAVLAGVAGMFGAGAVAVFAVEWYNISSFEGGSGFFVVGMALVGGIGGFFVGLVVARIEAGRARPRFVRALGLSGGAIAAILLVIAGTSWWLADIPPQIDGEELFLQAELRWPASGGPPLGRLSEAPYMRLGATSGSVVRAFETGPLFVEDARQEDGRSIVPGVVPIFTSRGGRILDFGADDDTIAGFILPLRQYPSEEEREWSGWLPAARTGDPPLPDQFTYRYRVIRRSEPIRTEKIGLFEVDTVADYFYNVTESDRQAVRATFRIRHNGQSIPDVTTASDVAVVGGPKPALIVTFEAGADDTRCALLTDEGGAVRVSRLRGCGTTASPRLLTSDPKRFADAKTQTRYRLPGWLDRTSYAEPGLFQLDAAVIDTRAFTAALTTYPTDSIPNRSVPPLDLSPDENSFVWLVADDETPRLGVTNWQKNRSYVLPIDRVRMRYGSDASLNPEWVRHYFEWRRDPKEGDTLTERPDFVPLPYRGDLELSRAGAYQGYTLRPGGEALRKAVVDLLVSDLAGEKLPEDSGGFTQRVRVKGKQVDVSVLGTPSYVNVSMSGEDADPALVTEIAAYVDKVLATGRFDALFVTQ